MKKALTFIEIVFVIVIIGIISAVLAPNFQSESLPKAAHQLASHIRYTQHLALMDDRFANADNWHQSRWHIRFGANSIYSVGRDNNRNGSLNSSEIASNPSDRNLMLTGDITLAGVADANYTRELNLAEKYGIQTNWCNNAGISFDYLGRPISSNSAGDTTPYTNMLMQNPCIITLTDQNNDANITIEPETGYVHINF